MKQLMEDLKFEIESGKKNLYWYILYEKRVIELNPISDRT